MQTLKLIKMGESTVAVLPEEMLTRLKVESGSTLQAVETPDGYLLTVDDTKLQGQLETGRQFMKDYRETFKALAE